MDDLFSTPCPWTQTADPSSAAIQLNDETTDAPTYELPTPSKVLYLNEGKLKLIDRSTKVISTVPG